VHNFSGRVAKRCNNQFYLHILSLSPITSLVSPFMAVPASLVCLVAVVVLASTHDLGQDVTPFTVQEWVWAATGGFLPNMIEHYIRNGGL
jgi:hypothetical protein